MKKTTGIVIGSLVIALVLLITGIMLGGLDELHQSDLQISLPFVRSKDFKREFDEVRCLDIDAAAGNFEIIEYNGSKIEVEAKNVSYKTDLYQKDDTLVFKDSFRFGNLPIANSTKVKIYVPKKYYFKQVKINVDAATFKAVDLYADEIEIDVDAGTFKAENIVASKTIVNVDAGDAKIDLLDSENSDFDADVGDIRITMKGRESDYSYESDCDLGDVKIGSYRSEGISDEYSYRGGNRFIVVDCNVGSVKIKMEV